MVKFGKRLLESSNGEWTDKYLDYKQLKKIIKKHSETGGSEEAELKEFNTLLDQELAKVSKFAEERMSSLRQVLEALEPQFEFENTPDEIRKRFGELQQNISNLRSYVALNYMAVVKIMKKQTKNYPNSDNYDASQLLLSQSFYTSKSLSEVMHRSDKLEANLNGTDVSKTVSSRTWVLSDDGPHEAAALLGGLRQRGAQSQPRECGLGFLSCEDASSAVDMVDMNPNGSRKILVVAIQGGAMDAMLLARTPNIETLVKMGAANGHLDAPNDAVNAALENLWGRHRESPQMVSTGLKTQVIGGTATSDMETVTKATDVVANGDAPNVVVVHMNGAQAAKMSVGCGIGNEQYRSAIEKLDAVVAPLVPVLHDQGRRGEAWSCLICSDSSSTVSGTSSSLMQMAPSALNESTDDVEVEAELEELSWPATCLYIFGVFASLYSFLFGLGLMGDSFKVLGGKSAGDMFSSIDNPISGLMVGVLATVLLQSSSTTTSIVVGMVGADIFTVETAIPVIMGANIGTTVTPIIVSLGQIGDVNEYRRAFGGASCNNCYNIIAVTIMLPLEAATGFLYHFTSWISSDMRGAEGGTFKSPIKIIVSPLTKLLISVDKKKVNKIANGEATVDSVGSLLKPCALDGLDDKAAGAIGLTIALIVLCIGLVLIVKFLRTLCMGKARGAIMSSLKFTKTWWGGYIAMLIGAGATIAVQSSSITTSTLTPLVGVGVITLEQMFPLTLGANLGTTCTGLLAALVTGKVNGLQIALCHVFFNVFGIAACYPIEYLRNIPLGMARKLGIVAGLLKWFPPVYIMVIFVVIPLIFIGISNMFTAGTVGVVFGIITIVILLALVIAGIYWFVWMGGQRILMEILVPTDVLARYDAECEKLAAEEEMEAAESKLEEAATDKSIHT